MITILTRKLIPFRLRELGYWGFGLADQVRGRPPRRLRRYGGHDAINRSLFDGLRNIGIPFNVDPAWRGEIFDNVLCIADPRAIAQAIRWKRAGRIGKLFAGFAIVGSPLDAGSVILDGAVDRYVCFSDWHRDSFDEQAPGFKDKAVVCPFGVDPNAWRQKDSSRMNILFYRKRAPRKLYDECLNAALSAGFAVEEIQYGSYTLEQYAAALERNSLVVNWVDHETQGISMAEAWASNVPTLVWNAGSVFQIIHGTQYVFDCSSSPYLTVEVGRFFRDRGELEQLLAQHSNGILSFTPRSWILRNLTDTICAKRLVTALGLERPNP
jgi:hypothetical protein